MYLLASPGSFNNWNIIILLKKSNPYDAFVEIHQFVFDGIIYNMALLVEPVKYGAINTTDSATNGFYFIIFTSEAYTLQDKTKFDGKIITAVNWLSKYNIFVLCK